MMPVKPKKPEKATKDFDDFERVTRWRYDALIKMGLKPDQAIALIELPDVAHAAKALADRGCPPDLIVALLGRD
jgi:hypothetical protein